MNNQLYPFERNRYYTGKMLTSADFLTEQAYMNNKRRFLNNLLFGAGIVCGCSVYSLDDLSIFVESGFAIDHLGHEIIIDNSVVRKLSAINGFDHISSDRLSLCLRYREEQVHPVYSIKKQGNGQEFEYNHVKEGYELFLLDSDSVKGAAPVNDEFLAKEYLVKNEDYEVVLSIPTTVCKGRYVSVRVTAVKLSDTEAVLDHSSVLKTPSFVTEADGHELDIRFDSVSLKKGEKLEKKYWVYVQEVPSGECILTLNNDASAKEATVTVKTIIADIDPSEIVNREIARPNLEHHDMNAAPDYICLADISLIRNGSAYIIQNIKENSVKKFIETPAVDILRRNYLEYFFPKDIPMSKSIGPVTQESYTPVPISNDKDVKIATGTLEIPVGKKVKPGSVFYSGEIMHGLGAGTVYVELGSEYVDDEPVQGANVKSTVFGDASLFNELEGKSYNVTTAVKVLNDKGSFVVAAKFEEDTECTVLTFRWVAIKFANTGANEAAAAETGQWIEAETPTAVIGARENYYFGVKFHNMEQCSVCYEVTEEGGGSISADGVYTAPSKEGVYEIRIYCMDRPFVSTYAYAVVKRK